MIVRQAPTYLGKSAAVWADELKSEDPLIRRLAAYALGMIGPEGRAESLPALTRALQDDEGFVRAWAAAALAQVEPTDPGALAGLIAAMRDPIDFVRSLGAWHIGRVGARLPTIEPALPVLQQLLNDVAPSVRAEAAIASKVLQLKNVRR
jgi:HEAT repeat protein